MKYRTLREAVLKANRELFRSGLAPGHFGNASGVDRAAGTAAIKPSGVDYETLRTEEIPVVSLDTGAVKEGKLRPSMDTQAHLVLYRAFPFAGGVVHTHSPFATAFAQAMREIPPLGTTHADFFRGAVPVTRLLTEEEVRSDYEEHTGRVVVERFEQGGLDPHAVPGVLVAGHGPFAWGRNPAEAVANARALEEAACLAFRTLALNPEAAPLPAYLLDKHYLRKHGPGAYYGQAPRPGSEEDRS